MQKHIEHSFAFSLGLIAISGLMLASFAYTSRMPERQARQGQWVNHTHEAIGALNLLESYLYKEAIEQQGRPHAAPGTDERRHMALGLDRIQALMADNNDQQGHIAELRRLAPGALADPSDFLRHLGTMREKEERLLAERQSVWEQALERSKVTAVVVQLLLFAAVLALYRFLFRELVRRRRAIDVSHAEAGRLHRIVSLQNAVTTEDLDINGMMTRVVEKARELVNADGCVIERIEGDMMVYEAASGGGTPFIGLRIPIRSSFSGKSVTEQAVLRCDDAETDQHVDQAACKRVGVRSMVVVPLMRKGAPFGVLKVFSSQRAAFGVKDVDTMEIVAALLSARINDAAVFTAIREVNRELASQKEELLFSNAQLGELAATDGLTNLRNHRRFMEKLGEEFRRAQRYGTDFSLVLLDVDHFKKFNDGFGHVAGDGVLKQVAGVMKQIARDTDILARHGGEEFSLILPNTSAEGALVIAERLRNAVADAPWDLRKITISVGVSTYTEAFAQVKDMLESADKALYAAKDGGRNCVRRHAGE